MLEGFSLRVSLDEWIHRKNQSQIWSAFPYAGVWQQVALLWIPGEHFNETWRGRVVLMRCAALLSDNPKPNEHLQDNDSRLKMRRSWLKFAYAFKDHVWYAFIGGFCDIPTQSSLRLKLKLNDFQIFLRMKIWKVVINFTLMPPNEIHWSQSFFDPFFEDGNHVSTAKLPLFYFGRATKKTAQVARQLLVMNSTNVFYKRAVNVFI